MKILYLTDTHIRGTTPKNRKDNLLKTLEKKFQEVLTLSNELEVDFILHGGDLFDRPDITPSISRIFAIILNKFKMPIYTIAGNHDIYGHNPDTLHRTMLGLFDAIGLINLINKDEPIILEKNGVKVQLTSQPYVYDIDSYKDNYIVTESDLNVDYKIHMVHGMLLDKPFIEGIPYTLVENIKDTKADITLAGHYHSGFGVINLNGKFFVNPGSLIRITNSLREIERIPKIVLIELKDKIDIKLIPIETAKPGTEVLDRKQVELSMYRNRKILEFKQSVDSSMDFDKLDINHIINDISTSENLSKEVKKEAVKRISDAHMLYKGDDTQ